VTVRASGPRRLIGVALFTAIAASACGDACAEPSGLTATEASDTANVKAALAAEIPFHYADFTGRGLHRAPLSTARPPFESREHPERPGAAWDGRSRPLPTNTFWQNLTVGSGEHRIALFPYTVRALPRGLVAAAPRLVVTERAIFCPADDHFALSAAEPFSKRSIAGYDDLSVTVTWTAESGTLSTPLVQGMPYVTGLYKGITPVVEMGRGIVLLSVNGSTSATHSGKRFDLRGNNGQRWLVWASEIISFRKDGDRLVAASPFHGHIRAALVTDSAAETVFDKHARAIPVGGEVSATIETGIAHVRFHWKSEGEGPLLIAALPHHQPRLQGAMAQPIEWTTLRGTARGVSGETWELDYPLPAIEWTAPRPIAAGRRAAVERALESDRSWRPDPKTAGEDPYFGGKQLAKLGRLALIAEELGRAEIAAELRSALKPLVESWLTGANANPLVYDETYGGLVVTSAIGDRGAGFGQGWYNDHHFHYGYLVYAAAVVAKGDPAFAAKHREALLAVVRDIVNPSRADPHFAVFRHLDWYAGHSWAAGLFEFGDNRNQESTSEAVNAWYAVHLLGLALGDTNLADLGAITTAVEIASTQEYWQVKPSRNIYPAPFRDYGVVGILWSTKVDIATFFGANPEFIFGIQMLPFTPITEALLDPVWIREIDAKLSAAAANAGPGWAGFLQMARGIRDPDAAWSEVAKLNDFDDGNSRTNTLWWLATRR
jgi:endo-1,3(4)-beta-glucanase